MQHSEPIDIVIAWVDGDDPAHREKMRPYLKESDAAQELIAAPTRFRQAGEIFFSVASVLRFAPFVRRIYIVTDEQDPGLDDFVEEYFPDRTTEIIIVDHKDIFRGYEQYLPTFNARCIGCCLFRIPGLAENFVYMNDDFVLIRPVEPEDWFPDGKVMARGRWRNILKDKIADRLTGRVRPYSFKNAMRNAAMLFEGRKRFFHITHTPHPQKKSLIEEFHALHPDNISRSLVHKFRSPEQYDAQALGYLLAFDAGMCRVGEGRELYMKPVGRRDKYVESKIADADNGQPLSVCIQALDMASEEDRRKIFAWLEGLLGVKVLRCK